MSAHRLLAGTIPAILVFAACGGRIGGQGDGGADAGVGDSTIDGAGWTACSSPSGYELCGGPDGCNPNCAFCTGAPVGFCGDANNTIPSPFTRFSSCADVPDGSVCWILGSRPDGGAGQVLDGLAITWEAGELLYRAGYGGDLLFADSSNFDGSPLPEPSACPAVPGLTLCGATCGDTCPHDSSHACIGRSPEHPYSLCVNVSPASVDGSPAPHCSRTNPPGDGKHGCLIFRDDPASQPIADINGAWIDLPTCQAAAAGYPGGADCVTQ